ncbi:addiction module toxin RelE [Serratia inhibens]|uniref:Addiction module toxin RelE n=1 Tax=Serratia inhibens TaxID=2338073 RepID=A0AA93BWF7_9GAMM|nr:addiction module toxin RelE [Serratia inhibens]
MADFKVRQGDNRPIPQALSQLSAWGTRAKQSQQQLER